MAKKRKNSLNRKIQYNNRRLKRLNERIGRLDPDQDKRRDQLTKRRDAIEKQRGKLLTRRDNRILSNPNQGLQGRNLMRVARQLEKLTSLPAIRAKQNEIGQIQNETDRDIGKLGAMGQRLEGQVGNLRQYMDSYGQEAYAQSERTGQELQDRLANTAQQSVDRTNQLQSSVLGGQMSMFQNQNINPASSGSAGLIAQFAQAGQGATAANAQANQQLGALMSAANLANTQATTTAANNTLSNQAIQMQRNITTRQADRQNVGSDALRAARSELGTLQGLRGAELVNQLMKLRGTERDFFNDQTANDLERLAIETQARGDRAARAIDRFEAQTDRMKVNKDGGSGGSSGSGDGDDISLNRQEWRNFRDAADQHLGGGSVGNWNKFFDAVAKIEGVNWTPSERRKFAKKYKKRYFKNR